jgi:light-dependent protochlorophyllide reductase
MTTRQTMIITGGNAGLGYECVREIAATRPDWHIVVASRSPERSEPAVAALKKATNNPDIEFRRLDLASLASVRQFVREFKSRPHPPLRSLICNAGLQMTSTLYTDDGFEMTFGVNQLGHFLLVNLLLDELQTPANVIFLGSGTHDPAQKTPMPVPLFETPERMAHPFETGENVGMVGRRRYSTSKLCNILTAYELERRLTAAGRSGISVNVFDPGLMPGTGLARSYGPIARFLWSTVFHGLRLINDGVSTSRQSGKMLARLATNPEMQKVSGKYFTHQNLKQIRSSDDSYDTARACELWEGSAALVQLAPHETPLAVGAAANTQK